MAWEIRVIADPKKKEVEVQPYLALRGFLFPLEARGRAVREISGAVRFMIYMRAVSWVVLPALTLLAGYLGFWR